MLWQYWLLTTGCEITTYRATPPNEKCNIVLCLAVHVSSAIRMLSVNSVLCVIRMPTNLLLVLSVPPDAVLHAAQPHTAHASDL